MESLPQRNPGTKYPHLFAALGSPFEPGEVKVRSAPGGNQFHYITARTAMNRLDNVLGPEDWWDEYIPSEHSVLCRLTIRLPDGTTLTKSDAGGYAGMADSGDDDKSGYSDSFKRAAVKFGVARYLYKDGVPKFVREYSGQTAPVPEPVHQPDVRRPANVPTKSGRTVVDDVPRDGRQLYAWANKEERDGAKDLLKSLVRFGRQREYPDRIIDWNSIQTGEAVAALRTGHSGRNGHQNPDADDIEEGEDR